jgi:uncharacterized protein
MVVPYHAGELAVQARAGTVDQAAGMARTMKADVPGPLARFLPTQRWIVIGGTDSDGRVWASVVTGEPGFVHAVDSATVHIAGHPAPRDPLSAIGVDSASVPVGMLAIDFARRLRARINGRLRRDGEGLEIEVEQAYANCMKYIQRRQVSDTGPLASSEVERTVGDRLSSAQMAAVRLADTAFIATIAKGYGADASHRGGPPGFLSCSADGGVIEFADYPGNGMFNTLGNIVADGRAGLTIPVFGSGDVLALTGRASLTTTDGPAQRARILKFVVDRVVELPGALPFGFGPVEYSPFLPVAEPGYRALR